MDATTAQRLAHIIKHNGSALLEDQRSLLRLLAPDNAEVTPAIEALMRMVDTGAVKHLRKWAQVPAQSRPSYAQLREHMAAKYEQSGKLSAAMAAWALDAWVHALPDLNQAVGAAVARAEMTLEAPPPPSAAVPAAQDRNPYEPPAAPVADVPQPRDEDEPQFIENGQALSAGRGAYWIKEGWRLFAAQPVMWWVCLLIVFGISVVTQIVPVLGPVVSAFLSPILWAGLLLGAHGVRQGERLTVSDTFAGFRTAPGTLVGLTLVQFALVVAVVAVVMVLFWSQFSAAMTGALGSSGPSEFLASLGLALLVLALLLTPVMAACYFAVALVAVGGQGVFAALRMSFWGCMKNVLPFLIYFVLIAAAAFVATVPLGLGWLLLVPVIVTSTYAAYRDVFYADEA